VPGSKSISDSGCANNCPWHTGESDRQSFPHSPRSASTTEIPLQQVGAGHFLQGSPLCLPKHKETEGETWLEQSSQERDKKFFKSLWISQNNLKKQLFF